MDTLKIAGLDLKLIPSTTGPRLATEDPRVAPLAWVVNAGLAGVLPDLASAVESGREVITQGLSAARPDPGEDLSEQKAGWRALTGTPAGEDLYILGATFSSERMLVPRQVLLDILVALRDLRSGTAPEPGPGGEGKTARPGQPALFEPGSQASRPLSGEEESLRDLELAALALDTVAGSDDPQIAQAVGAKRLALFARLEAAGLFDPHRSAEKLNWLNQWQLPVLTGYHTAAVELGTYYRSPERRRYINDEAIPPIVGGPVSVDWFRLQVPVPPDDHPYTWLGFFESILATADLVETLAGELLSHVGDRWFKLTWRREDGATPALVRAEKIRG